MTTRDQLERMSWLELRVYVRKHYSSITRIVDRVAILRALDRQAEKEGGYRS